MHQDFEKIRIAMRYWQLGHGYHVALRAMNFAQSKHTGLRKDTVTPEFQHQVSQANFARTLIDQYAFPEETLATIWLHDVCEDYDVSISTITEMFGSRIAYSTELMTNQVSGVKKPLHVYYSAMAYDPIASIAKGIDRMHNHQSMHGVFSLEKQQSYIEETETYILPMLHVARNNFPEQEAAYQNIKHVLQIQIELIREMLTGIN
jgi:(p)ppGpp synthase/HD superfamily hydrolase